ncbi:unnamed protein product [Trifolium pratense]|uniref:Uncharacterized protein n=1 Tax=Trifolium pratense TaxID=57577 RepID=A0ACB0K2R2_TRIPR|nr:unnamed protein product [Trifolium pratense]
MCYLQPLQDSELNLARINSVKGCCFCLAVTFVSLLDFIFTNEGLFLLMHTCIGGCRIVESSQHIFKCSIFSKTWYGIVRWLGLAVVFHSEVKHHFFNFIGVLKKGFNFFISMVFKSFFVHQPIVLVKAYVLVCWRVRCRWVRVLHQYFPVVAD